MDKNIPKEFKVDNKTTTKNNNVYDEVSNNIGERMLASIQSYLFWWVSECVCVRVHIDSFMA